MVDASIWDQEIAVPETVISYVDENVKESKLSIAFRFYPGLSPHGSRLGEKSKCVLN
jgi:hypothetical protein